MKEKDFVDFTKMEQDEDGNYLDENGKDVGCHICYIHQQVYDKYNNKHGNILIPRCPNCGELLTNYSNPDGEIGLYSI